MEPTEVILSLSKDGLSGLSVWYKQLRSDTAQAVTQELRQAYKSWLGHRRNGNPKARPPSYRKRNGQVSPSTITFRRSGFRLEGTRLRLARGKAVAGETGEQSLFPELAIPPRADVSALRYVQLVPLFLPKQVFLNASACLETLITVYHLTRVNECWAAVRNRDILYGRRCVWSEPS